MDFTGIVISIIIAIIALTLGIVGTILLFSTSTAGKYKWGSLSLAVSIITIVFCVIFLKFAYDNLLNGWLVGFMALLIVLNPLLASIGAYETGKNVTTNIVGVILLLITIGLILIV